METNSVTVEHNLSAGQLAMQINKSPDLTNKEKKFTNNTVNQYREKDIIPSFLVAQHTAHRRYAVEAIEWAVLAVRIRRNGSAATFEKIGKIMRWAVEAWGASQSTIVELTSVFNANDNYSEFVRALMDLGLILSDDVIADAALREE